MSNSTDKKRIYKYGRLIILVVILCLIYMAVIQPLIASLFFPPIVHSGVELYSENQYLKYDYAGTFESAISMIPLSDSAEVKAFSYYDHCLRDNLFYGEFSDAFVLDLLLNQQYETAKEFVVQNSNDCISGDSCEIHWIQKAVSTDNACFFVVVSDQKQMIRCILITNYENTIGFAGSVDSVLLRNFGIDWSEDIPSS